MGRGKYNITNLTNSISSYRSRYLDIKSWSHDKKICLALILFRKGISQHKDPLFIHHSITHLYKYILDHLFCPSFWTCGSQPTSYWGDCSGVQSLTHLKIVYTCTDFMLLVSTLIDKLPSYKICSVGVSLLCKQMEANIFNSINRWYSYIC